MQIRNVEKEVIKALICTVSPSNNPGCYGAKVITEFSESTGCAHPWGKGSMWCWWWTWLHSQWEREHRIKLRLCWATLHFTDRWAASQPLPQGGKAHLPGLNVSKCVGARAHLSIPILLHLTVWYCFLSFYLCMCEDWFWHTLGMFLFAANGQG